MAALVRRRVAAAMGGPKADALADAIIEARWQQNRRGGGPRKISSQTRCREGDAWVSVAQTDSGARAYARCCQFALLLYLDAGCCRSCIRHALLQ